MQKIKENLLMQKRELERYFSMKYIKREIKFTELDKDIIKVVTGPRRAGKSFFTIHGLKNLKHFGYVNFDDENLVRTKNYNDIVETVNSLYKEPKILFLDEIQNLPDWELFVSRLQRQGFNLIITGSNSNLLSRELSTHLTGRHLSTIIFPFSFKEYLNYFNKEFTQSEIKVKLPDFLNSGGFPEPLAKELNYDDYLKTLYDSIIFKDIVRRYNIKIIKSLEELASYFISNFGNLISYKSLTRITSIKSVHTIEKYLKYFEETFLFFKINAFSYKVKEQIRSNKKIYVIDNGFIKAKSFSFSENAGKLFENQVAIVLKKRQLNGEIEFYYYKNPQGYEVDFVIKKGKEVKELIQVCYNIDEEKIKKREIRALLHASKDLKCNNLVVITDDYEKNEAIEWFGLRRDISFIPLWKWLLEGLD